jgi:prepilin-type N-terminal cleavage/methylation domain-containing protein
MKPELQAKYLQFISSKKNKEEGFTLIELLVVVIIIGVLAAVALPNLLGQVGKARETEGKNGIGNLNRAQQALHFEKQNFGPAYNSSELASNSNVLGVVITSSYYNFATTAGTSASVTQTATAKDANKDGVRAYSGGVGFASGQYGSGICQTDAIGADAEAPTVSGATVSCNSTTQTLLK